MACKCAVGACPLLCSGASPAQRRLTYCQDGQCKLTMALLVLEPTQQAVNNSGAPTCTQGGCALPECTRIPPCADQRARCSEHAAGLGAGAWKGRGGHMAWQCATHPHDWSNEGASVDEGRGGTGERTCCALMRPTRSQRQWASASEAALSHTPGLRHPRAASAYRVARAWLGLRGGGAGEGIVMSERGGGAMS